MRNFIRDIVEEDLRTDKHNGRVATRFPPEPNGYPHIGHAKSICLNFGLAQQFDGTCHLRFDDTNPSTEDIEYVEAIKRDVRWLGFEWGEHEYYASDYFEQLYSFAVQLIESGEAYVCSLDEAQIREYRGSLSEPGRPSPDRDRPAEQSLDLFERMKAGEFKEGQYVLRAKIDMASANMKMRDPLLYRIRHEHHYRRGDAWCIYPFYDFAHCLSDSIEDITHSICTLEFENNRELYDWLIAAVGVTSVPRQYEFARLSLEYTIMSKRKLLQLVQNGHVSGWDDPRMPTISGMRRRGYTAEAIRAFCEMIGVAKANSTVDFGKLEYAVRNDLNHKAPRVMCVLDPLKVVLTNWPEGQVEHFEASHWPHDVPREGTRQVPFSGELYIERADFMETPEKKFFRLAPGREVRLRFGYYIRCEEVIKDDEGHIVELRCTYDPETKGGKAPDGRKVKGTLHWVSAAHALPVEVRVYDRLFSHPKPGSEGRDFLDDLNTNSLTRLTGALIEPSAADADKNTHFQFERQGYFITDSEDSAPGALVFNRTVTLKDSWAKKTKATPPPPKAPSPKPKAQKERPKKRNRAYERQKAREANPVLAARLTRYTGELGLSESEADLLSASEPLGTFFEEALGTCANAVSVARWMVNDLLGSLKDTTVGELPFGPAAFGTLVQLSDEKAINNTAAKEVLSAMLAGEGDDPRAIVKARGLEQVDDSSELETLINKVMADHPNEAERYKGGEKRLMGFFMGQIMRASGGKANAGLVRQILQSLS